MRIKMKRFLGILLTLTLVLGLMPGMSLTAYAETYSGEVDEDVALQAGDIIEPNTSLRLSINYDTYRYPTVVLKAGGYCESSNLETPGDEDIRRSMQSVINFGDNGIIDDCYLPYAGGKAVSAWIVDSVEDDTITLIGYREIATWVSGDCTVSFENDTLTVTKKEGSGNGAMADADQQTPWADEKYVNKIIKVTVGSGVTRIGNRAFSGLSNVTSVSLPDSLTAIGKNAFRGVSPDNIQIPGSVTAIEEEAFANASMVVVTFLPASENETLTLADDVFNGNSPTLEYGAGGTILYDGNTAIIAGTEMTSLQGKTLTWKQPAVTQYAALVPTDSDDAAALAAKKVTFNGKPWYIIKDESVSDTDGRLTLLAADNSFGVSKYHDDSYEGDFNYSISMVHNMLSGLTSEGGDFYEVKDAIKDTNLLDVIPAVHGAKLYLLSYEEAALPVNVIKLSFTGTSIGYNAYWLRSHSEYNPTFPALVDVKAGSPKPNGGDYHLVLGVRPALKLDLSKVTFNSTSKTFSLKYPLWVGGVQVTSANKDDVLGDVDQGETVIFTPAEDDDAATTDVDESRPAILTLNGATISGGNSDSCDGAIYADGIDLTINVTGDSTVTGPAIDSEVSSEGIYISNGSLNITGSGILTAKGGKCEYRSIGVLVDKEVTINGTLNAIGDVSSDGESCGIYATGGITVNSEGILTVTSGAASSGSYGIFTTNVTVNGSLTATGYSQAINGTVKNSIAGTGWTDTEGTTGKTSIAVSEAGQELNSYKKVQFPAVPDPVAYIDHNATTGTAETKACTSYTAFVEGTNSTLTTIPAGWYVIISGNAVATNRLVVNGTVNLILCDGATLIARKGITVTSGNTLNIYAGSIDETILGTGKLYAGTTNGIISTCEGEYAGIGGNVGAGGGKVTIHGGEVTALGNTKGAGIGGGNGGAGGTVTIYGGTVTTGGDGQGKGIGAGHNGTGNGKLTLGTGMYLYGGTSANPENDPSNHVAKVENEYARSQYMTVNNNSPHSHDFTYIENGAVITATCANSDQEHIGDTTSTLTIVKPTLTTYGGTGSETATLSGLAAFNSATGLSVEVTDIKYVGREGTSYNESATAPTNVGKYTAKITITGVKTSEGDDKSVTACVDYEIARIAPVADDFTYAAPSDLTYDGTAKTATVTANEGITGMGNVTVKYYSDAACDAEVENPTAAGTYYVGITVAEGDNFNAATSVLHGSDWMFTIGKTAPTADNFNFTAPSNLGYDGNAKSATVIANLNATGMGQVTVKYYSDAACTAEVENPTAADTYYVGITVAEGDNYSAVTSVIHGASWTFTITKANPTADAPTDLTATYGQTLANVSLEGKNPEGNTPGTWTWADAATTSVGSVGDRTFKANFTPTDTTNYNSKSNVDVTVTVGKADNPATVTSTATVTKGGNTVDLAGNVTLNGATGAISYAIDGEAKGCTLNGSILTSGDTAGTVTVNVTVATDNNYNTLAATPITVTISDKGTQTISADDVTATFGDADKAVSATVTEPATGGGDISYAVKEGSADYISVNESTGALTINAVPADGKAYVVVTAAETQTYAQATKEVTVTINKANAVAATVTANNRTFDSTEKPLVTVDNATLAGGTMWYALGENATTAPADNLYTTSIPAKTNAGIYYVWYKVDPATNYNGVDPACIVVEIEIAKGEAIFEKNIDVQEVNGVVLDEVKTQLNKIAPEIANADNTEKGDNQIKDITVTLETKAVTANTVPKNEASAIMLIANNKIPSSDKESSKISYLNINVNKNVKVYNVDGSGMPADTPVTDQDTTLTTLPGVIDIPVKYDLTNLHNLQVARYHGDKAEAFTKLDKKPTSPSDLTFFVEGSGATAIVHIYTKEFSTYALITSGTKEYKNESSTTTPTEKTEPTTKDESVTVYRLYYGPTMEHFYTTSAYERKVLIDKCGWVDEGIAWKSPKAPTTDEEKKTIKPVYRLFNPFTTDHHYTKDANERKTLIDKYGWKDEGIAFYSNDKGDATVYRLWHPGLITGAHHFTTGKHEYDVLITRGWIGETEAFKVNAAS